MTGSIYVKEYTKLYNVKFYQYTCKDIYAHKDRSKQFGIFLELIITHTSTYSNMNSLHLEDGTTKFNSFGSQSAQIS